MIADGFWREGEFLGYLGIVVSLRDELEDFALAVGQLGEKLGRLYAGEKTRQAFGDFEDQPKPDGSAARKCVRKRFVKTDTSEDEQGLGTGGRQKAD